MRDSLSDRPAALSGVRVLVVEDEWLPSMMLTAVLEEHGAIVVEVALVSQALEILEKIKPDIVICDIQLPDGNGFSLMRQIRDREAQGARPVPAIAVTASSWRGDRNEEQALSAGFQRYLSKPFEVDDLITEVISLVQGSPRCLDT